MSSAAQPGLAATPFLRFAAVALAAGYLALGWIGSSAGIGSLDANGIIRVVNHRLQSGAVEISRPPGHPLSENWVLPAAVPLFAGAGDPVLSPLGYGLYQLAGGIFCLVFFWLLLRECPISPVRRLLAVACLAFSPQFLITSSDGEEFLWGMACVFIAVLAVVRISRGLVPLPLLEWSLAVFFAVAASGYRIEYGAAALLVVFGTLFVSDCTWPQKLLLLAGAILLLLVVWMPVLIHQGVAQPYPNPLSLKTRLSLGLYKIVFHALGLIPLAIALLFVFQSRSRFRLLPSFRNDVLGYWTFWLIIIFFALFFLYPTKILVVMPGVAFLILLGAIHSSRWVWICFVAACLALQMAHLDCFRDRHWTGLKFQPSLWTQNLAEKPSAMAPRAAATARLAITGRHLVVSNIWPWGLAWQKAHAAWPGLLQPPADKNPRWAQCYAIGPGLVAPRSILDHPPQLAQFVRDGYDIWIDRDLYREMYMRYDLDAPTPATAFVGDVPCRIVPIQ